MPSAEVEYQIHGHEMQFVEIALDPGEKVVAESGAMFFKDPEIHMDAQMGDGVTQSSGFLGKVMNAGKRVVAGEGLFMTHFTNHGPRKAVCAFAAPYPGTIVPVHLAKYGGRFLCQKQAFLCAAAGTSISLAFTKRFGAGLFGGEGFALQKLEGDSQAFIHAGGTVVSRELQHGQSLHLDTGCLVGFTDGVAYEIETVPGIKTAIFGGEGLYFARLTGPGIVFLQSLPFSRMADRIISSAPKLGGRSVGEGSILGGIGRLIDGDNR